MAVTKLRVRVLEVGETESVGANNFQKRELFGMIEGEHPQYYKFEFVQKQAELLDNPIVLEGAYLTISYNLRSRRVEKQDPDAGEHPYNYYLSLSGWKIEE